MTIDEKVDNKPFRDNSGRLFSGQANEDLRSYKFERALYLGMSLCFDSTVVGLGVDMVYSLTNNDFGRAKSDLIGIVGILIGGYAIHSQKCNEIFEKSPIMFGRDFLQWHRNKYEAFDQRVILEKEVAKDFLKVMMHKY